MIVIEIAMKCGRVEWHGQKLIGKKRTVEKYINNTGRQGLCCPAFSLGVWIYKQEGLNFRKQLYLFSQFLMFFQEEERSEWFVITEIWCLA